MDLETARSLTFRVLQDLDFRLTSEIERAVCHEAERVGLLDPDWQRHDQLGQIQRGRDSAITVAMTVREVIWELLMQGILTAGWNDSNPYLPHARLTEWGRECVDAEEVVPYDRERYLEHLRTACPNLDSLTDDYVVEALGCFRTGCFRAASVMLGCASELTVDRLMRAYGDALADQAAKERYEKKTRAGSIKTRFDYFRKRLEGADLPPALADALDIQLDGIFTLLRYARNDSGHPTGVAVNRSQVFTNFQLFTQYCKRAHELMDWLGSNAV